MNQLVVAEREQPWHRLKAFVPDSVSSRVKRVVYSLGSDEFIASRGVGRFYNGRGWIEISQTDAGPRTRTAMPSASSELTINH
jgi:hypothetical protein